MRRTAGEPLVPPVHLHNVGDSDFKATGDELLALFREHAGLKPSDRVLDVGCGIGRLARPMAAYLGREGSYDGFDVAEVAIRWCQRHYAQHPNFRFRHVNIANSSYNPDGASPPERFTFPYPDAAFDFVFLTSVFTHMLPPGVERYMQEIARVLAPGGRCLATFFLLDDESRRLIAAGASTQAFGPTVDHHAIVDPEQPEFAVAYEEPWVLRAFRDVGVEPRTPPAYGSWCGRERFLSYQDIVIADRPEPRSA